MDKTFAERIPGARIQGASRFADRLVRNYVMLEDAIDFAYRKIDSAVDSGPPTSYTAQRTVSFWTDVVENLEKR